MNPGFQVRRIRLYIVECCRSFPPATTNVASGMPGTSQTFSNQAANQLSSITKSHRSCSVTPLPTMWQVSVVVVWQIKAMRPKMGGSKPCNPLGSAADRLLLAQSMFIHAVPMFSSALAGITVHQLSTSLTLDPDRGPLVDIPEPHFYIRCQGREAFK